MNHAFLILVHDSPELLERIIDRLKAPNHYFFIHLDGKSGSRKIDLTGVNGMYLPDSQRVKVYYGGFSMVLAEISLMKAALSFNEKMDYLHLISGHDYPCVNNKEFDKYFEECPSGMSFMHFDTDEQHKIWKTKIENRLYKWYFIDYNLPWLLKKIAGLVFKPIPRKKMSELYAGWQWFSWHRTLAIWVLDYLENHKFYLKRFRFSSCCDEVIFHTLLYNYADELNIQYNNALRYIDWYPKREYKSLPLILDERDFDDIVLSGSLFCRKVFLDQSEKLLDMLDERIFENI